MPTHGSKASCQPSSCWCHHGIAGGLGQAFRCRLAIWLPNASGIRVCIDGSTCADTQHPDCLVVYHQDECLGVTCASPIEEALFLYGIMNEYTETARPRLPCSCEQAADATPHSALDQFLPLVQTVRLEAMDAEEAGVRRWL